MRLAFLSAGSDIHTVRWVNAMAARGHAVHLLTMHAVREPVADTVGVDALPFPPPLGYLLNAPALRKRLGKLRPDLLHIHYASGYGTLGHLCGFQPQVLSVWGLDVYEFPSLSPLHRWLLRSNLRAADWVCSTSQVMASQTRSVCPEVKDLSVTPFGIDTACFRPAPGRRDRGALTIGTVKKLEAKYGIDTLLRAFALLRRTVAQDRPELLPRLRLLIVGGGPDEAKLRGLANELGLGDVTRFVGAVPHAEVPGYLHQMDVYVAVSRSDSESFGVAILEASACGLPVVVSDAGGLPEVVEDGTTGFVVRREDPEATAGALLKLVTDESLRRRMGGAGREHVITNYEWSDSVRQMEEIYTHILERTRGGRAA
jgi:glycosyltransferase involved in cell wall biosynthesis